MENQNASVVITHHILNDREDDYEKWLDLIRPIARKSKGNIDWQIIRPIPDLTFNYTVIIRFDTIENLKCWMTSEERKDLIAKAAPLFAKADHDDIKTGIDFLFASENNKINAPVRWKQFLLTWSAIYILSAFIPLLILPVLHSLTIPANRSIDSFFISGMIVFLIVYIVIPNYTKLIKNWLYK